ncbi:hypothetical protein GW17_00020195 [Ensete ventricosum]|nr:hypothetical protein GW17_00020195 [Ensete ventricosum]RZR89556.1 hypothetical protein BHM03_00017309 [Ensete ventricosum]
MYKITPISSCCLCVLATVPKRSCRSPPRRSGGLRDERREAGGEWRRTRDVLSVSELGEQAAAEAEAEAEAKTVPEDRLDSAQARLFVSYLFMVRHRVVRCFAYTKTIKRN